MTRPSAPHVSVVVPAFNAAKTLDACLDSIARQTYRDFDVTVVDDGSTDGTGEVVARFPGPVTVLRQPNLGPGAARNLGIRHASGPLVAFLDADDLWLPGKLEAQAEYFVRFPDTGLLHTEAIVGDERVARSVADPSRRPMAAPRWVFCDLFHTDLDINTLTVMARLDLLLSLGGFDERREIHVEDWDLWLRIAAVARVGHLPWATAVRRPGGAMSRAVERTFAGQAAVIRKLTPTCARVCDRHRAAPAACLRRRWHRFHWERSYSRLRQGRRAAAAVSLATAVIHRPFAAANAKALAALVGGPRLSRLAGRRRGSPVPAPASSPLVHDTAYWRARHAATSGVHAIDDLVHRLRNGDRVRVLFDAASPMSFSIFQPVYEVLRSDPRLDFWFTATGATWNASDLYARVGVHCQVLDARRAAGMKVDLCINTDFWDLTWLRRRTRRVHLFHGVAGKYGLDAPVELAPTVATFDRVMFPNADRLERYVAAGLVAEGGPVAQLVGYPKIDRLVNGSLDRDTIAATIGLDAAPTVLYAPTWSPFSSLNAMGERIIDELAAMGVNVLVKLHDRSYDRAHRGSGGIDWTSRLKRCTRNPRVRIVSDPDATPYLAVADVLVTDHSSIGFEFTVLDRPLVVVDCPELIARARVTPARVRDLRSAAEVADTPEAVVSAVCRQLEEPSLHDRERRCIAAAYFYRPGTATARAVAVVYDALGLDAPLAPRQSSDASPPVAGWTAADGPSSLVAPKESPRS